MKFFSGLFGPVSRICVGLVSLTLFLVFVADLAFGVLRDDVELAQRLRKGIAEDLAIQLAVLIQKEANAALAEAARLRAMDAEPSSQMELGKLIGTIKKLNDNKSLQDWAKNTNPDTGAKVMVDKIKQKAYNETLYNFVETRTGAEYQDARKLMHDHMAIEKQVADKAVTFMRRAPKGFFDVVDPHLALEFARGLWKLDPSAIVGSGAGWFVKRQWKKMNSPDHNIKQMFKTTDKYLPEREPFDASKLPTQTIGLHCRHDRGVGIQARFCAAQAWKEEGC